MKIKITGQLYVEGEVEVKRTFTSPRRKLFAAGKVAQGEFAPETLNAISEGRFHELGESEIAHILMNLCHNQDRGLAMDNLKLEAVDAISET